MRVSLDRCNDAYFTANQGRPMVSDPDIYRAAKLLIDRHGADAGLRAAERADEMLEAGDMIGAAMWRRILKAIEELKRGKREGEVVN